MPTGTHGSTPPLPGGVDPRPDHVVTELDRIARRWAQLPLDDAVQALPLVRGTLADLLDDPRAGVPPDLGPGVVIDQLRVLAHDACARALAQTHPGPRDAAGGIERVGEVLTALRRALP